jgi:hypothetical protein
VTPLITVVRLRAAHETGFRALALIVVAFPPAPEADTEFAAVSAVPTENKSNPNTAETRSLVILADLNLGFPSWMASSPQ